MGPQRAVVAALALGALGGLGWTAVRPGEAQAYVRYVSKTGKPYAWREGCVWMLIYPNGMNDMTPAQVYAAEHAAQSAWTEGAQKCTYLEIIDADVPAAIVPPIPQYDLTNTTVFHSDRWCRKGGASDGTDCYPAEALAITSVWTTSDGHIYDADIEVNAVNWRWGDLVANKKDNYQDLQNTLTHETGHLIGLDHTCLKREELAMLSTRPVDNNGDAVPECDSLAADDPIRQTTMFPSALPGDIGKRVLSTDDVQALCDIYPATDAATHACTPPDTAMGPKSSSSGGCSVGGASSSAVGALLAGVGLLASRRRRKRR